MKPFKDLLRSQPGARIIVMGGGPTLADDLSKVRGDVYISANDHGAKLRPVDYVVAMDDVHTQKRASMEALIRDVTDAPIIGPHRYCDYFLTDWPGAPKKAFSGLVAAWCAWAMGGHPVILVGFDSYAGVHGQNRRAIRQARKFDNYITGQIRVVGADLGNSWPQYRKGERFGKYEEHSSIRGLAGIEEEIRIRARKPCKALGAELQPGDELTVARHEVRLLLKHRMVIEV